MKLYFVFLACVSSSLISMDPNHPPQLLLPIHEPRNLHDFIALKDRAGRIRSIPLAPRPTGSDSKILRIHSAGEVDQLDCESINNLIRIECSHATQILQSIAISNSVISTSLARENYHHALIRYQNALHHLIQAFHLKCYKTVDKLHEVLAAFIDAEEKAPHIELDEKFQQLYEPLEKIISKAEKKARVRSLLIPPETTKELVGQLAVPPSPTRSAHPKRKIGSLAIKSLENGNAYVTAGKELLKNLQDPTLESYNTIEIHFFLALEHFITAYHRDINQGLEQAESALQELEAVHILKKNKFGKEGQRLALAQEKIARARSGDTKIDTLKEPNLPEESSTRSISNNSASAHSLERYLREDATQEKTAPSSEEPSQAHFESKSVKSSAPSPLNSGRSQSSRLHESEKAVKEKDEIESGPDFEQAGSSKITPLSLIKSAWKNCKKVGKAPYQGAHYLWKKLPFN